MFLFKLTDLPKIPIFVATAGTSVPVAGLGTGTCYFIKPNGSVVQATNNLVEVNAATAKGWYTLQVAAADNLSAGPWVLTYETPTLFTNVGHTKFQVEASVNADIASIAGDSQAASNLFYALTDNWPDDPGPLVFAPIQADVREWGGQGCTMPGSAATAFFDTINASQLKLISSNNSCLILSGGAGTTVDAVTITTNGTGQDAVSITAVTPGRPINLGNNIVQAGVGMAAFPFIMRDSVNHQPVTGKTVTVTRSIDGGAFAAGTLGAVTEIGVGWYKCSLGTGDMLGLVVILRATASGCDDTFVRIVTQP